MLDIFRFNGRENSHDLNVYALLVRPCKEGKNRQPHRDWYRGKFMQDCYPREPTIQPFLKPHFLNNLLLYIGCIGLDNLSFSPKSKQRVEKIFRKDYIVNSLGFWTKRKNRVYISNKILNTKNYFKTQLAQEPHKNWQQARFGPRAIFC